MKSQITLAAAAILMAAGCSGGAHDAALPLTPTGGPFHKTTHARLLIKVPPQKHRKKIRVHGHYISPATASLTYTVSPALQGGATSGEVDINTSNPACSTTGVVGYLACTIDIVGIVPAIPYTFSFTTWDAAGGTGNVLSANDSVPFTATPGVSNMLSATLGGVASSLVVTPITPYQITGSSAALTVYGNHKVKFTVTPIDAQDNFIIGPGAPQPVASLAPGANASFAAVGAASPNEWTLTSTYEPTDPGIPSTTSLSVSATPVPGSGGSTVSASIPVKLYQPWIYVAHLQAQAITAYDEDGNVKTPAGGFPGLLGPTAIAYDPENGWLYVADTDLSSTNQVIAYDRTGNVKVAAFPVAPNLPTGIAFDSNNKWIYVAANGSGYAVAAYDEQGNLQATPGGFPTTWGFRQMAFDPLNKQLYLSSDNGQTIQVYDETGAAVVTSGGFPNIPHTNYTDCAGYDPIHDWIWTCDNQHLAAYDANGNAELPSTLMTGMNAAWNLAFDPYDGLIYVNGQSGPTNAYDQQGNKVALPTPIGEFGSSYSLGITVVK